MCPPAPATGGRPLANPDLFKPPPPSTSPKPPDGRRVAFRDTEDTEDIYNASPRLPPKDTTVGGAGSQQQQAGKPSKWQPLSTVDPNPISESDPFSLGDSDEEGIGAAGGKKDTPVKMDDNERLKKAAAEAMAESLVDPPKGEPAAKK